MVGILLLLCAASIGVGLICGRLYSFMALLFVTPLLAGVAYGSMTDQGLSQLGASIIAVAAVVLLQVSYLAAAKFGLRGDHGLLASRSTLQRKTRPTASGDVGPRV